MRGKKGYGPGWLWHQGMIQHHNSSVAPGKTFEAAVSSQCFLGCWAWASPRFPWREGLALCSEPGVQPGAHFPIPGETQPKGWSLRFYLCLDDFDVFLEQDLCPDFSVILIQSWCKYPSTLQCQPRLPQSQSLRRPAHSQWLVFSAWATGAEMPFTPSRPADRPCKQLLSTASHFSLEVPVWTPVRGHVAVGRGATAKQEVRSRWCVGGHASCQWRRIFCIPAKSGPSSCLFSKQKPLSYLQQWPLHMWHSTEKVIIA